MKNKLYNEIISLRSQSDALTTILEQRLNEFLDRILGHDRCWVEMERRGEFCLSVHNVEEDWTTAQKTAFRELCNEIGAPQVSVQGPAGDRLFSV